MMKNWLAAGAIALTAGMTTTVAQAQTTTVPGEQVGLATGAPLPEGIYAVNTFVYQGRDNPSAVDVGVNIPLLVWSTPWVPFGGRLELAVAAPTVFAFGKNGGPTGARDLSINVGTFIGGIWAFDLGGNFGVSLLGGAYLNDANGDRGVLVQNNGVVASRAVLPQLASNTYRVGIAGSYTGDGWNITANLTYNFYDSPGRFDTRGGSTLGAIPISDAFNLDLTATKKFGKFEIGAIGYGTVNLDPNLVYPVTLGGGTIGRQGRFLLGGLVGYDFGPFTAQAYVARTVARTADSFDSTEGWFRIIAPLYTPPAPVAVAPAPLVRKY